MRSQRIQGDPPNESIHLKQALLGLVVCDHQGLWSMAELDRHLTPSGDTPTGEEPHRALVEDAVEDLYAAGLIHRLGQFVCASRAAVEADRVAV
jgi:hypothetical protein